MTNIISHSDGQTVPPLSFKLLPACLAVKPEEQQPLRLRTTANFVLFGIVEAAHAERHIHCPSADNADVFVFVCVMRARTGARPAWCTSVARDHWEGDAILVHLRAKPPLSMRMKLRSDCQPKEMIGW